MTQLALLRTQLHRLRRRRAAVRWGLAGSAVALVLLWSLAGLFLLDWSLSMSRPQRIVALLLVIGIVAWACRRFLWPCLRQHETDIDMALLIERQQQIDSDLVAALQFEQPLAQAWGSRRLSSAVVQYVAEFSPGLNVFEGFSFSPLLRRLTVLAATVSVLVLLGILYPEYARVFGRRLFLGTTHYPTQTRIDGILVNGRPVDSESNVVHSPYGQPVTFTVSASGVIPARGRIQIRALGGGRSTELQLERGAATGGKVTFTADLKRLLDHIAFQVFLGDAWSELRTVKVIPRPIVEWDLRVTPPRYAGAVVETLTTSLRQVSVVEGSRVELTVRAINKPLRAVQLRIGDETISLIKRDTQGHAWSLPESSPFRQVRTPLRYELQVTDRDGLSLESPIQGMIQLKADRPPRVAAAMVSRLVLPTAKPRISYGAADDFGLSQVDLVLQVVRQNGRMDQFVHELQTVAEGSPETVIRGEYALDLSPYELETGDAVKLSVRATDDRGNLPPQSTVGEPLVLQVTDRNGILAGLLETDQQSARQLDSIIQRQLGIGAME